MSNRYVIEPPTSGKVVLKTTHGEIHIELWAREAPLACRNFIQLCMEGFYDNSAFHRVISGFLIQAGEENGAESIYGGPFKDEFHSRLKFSHRGMVGMANFKRDDNRTQFFITLDKTPWLDRKNTIFGKVANNTIYNVIRISEAEVDKNDRPLILPIILSSEIIINPFEDIIPRELKSNVENLNVVYNKAKNECKAIFAYDDEEYEESNENKVEKNKILSSHDALIDPSLSRSIENYEIKVKEKPKHTQRPQSMVESEDEADFDLKMKKQILAKKEIFIEDQKTSPIKLGKYNVLFKNGETIVSKDFDPEEEFRNLKKSLQLTLKKNPVGTQNEKLMQQSKDEETFLSPLQKIKYNFYKYHQQTKGREHETLSKVNSFMQKVKEKEAKGTWFLNKLKFSVDSSKAFTFNKDLPSKAPNSDEDDKPVTDPIKRHKQFEDDSESLGLSTFMSIENLKKISTLP